jgi:cyclic pyranopterin phosphate synthase
MNGWKLDHVVPAEEIISRLNAELPLEPLENNYHGEVAQRYRYRDGGGEIGVIASVSKPFCGSCTRLRMSPEGTIYTCLFGTKGIDLREPLRSGATDADLLAIMQRTWQGRSDRYSEIRSSLTRPLDQKVEMFHIGG